MSKRILALFMALVLVLSLVPATVIAEGAEPAVHTDAHTCEHCTEGAQVTWTAWDGKTALTDGGHYYLADNVELSAPVALSSGSYVLCLGGKTLTATGTRHFDLSGTASLTIVDCTASGEGENYTAGTVTGATKSAFNLTGTASLTVYDGVFSGNRYANKTGYGGVILMNQASGTVTVKGGMFRDNYADYGGAIYMDSRTNEVQLTVENAYFTGNGGYHTGAIHFQYKVNASFKDTTITGNTITGANSAGIYTTNAAAKITFSGKMVVSGNTNSMASGKEINRNMILGVAAIKLNIDQLTSGSDIQFHAHKDVTDPNNALNVINQDSWDCNWLTMDTEPLSHDDKNADGKVQNGEFLAGHFHNSVKYTAIDGAALPTAAGCYYLTEDTQLPSSWNVQKDLTLCLNSHDLSTADGSRVLKTFNATPVTLVLEDCTGHTDADGNYIAGSIFGATNYAVGVATGSTFKMYGGKLTGNTGVGAVLLNNVMELHGGEISGNSNTANGGAIFVNANASLTVKGGTISGNTAGNRGGAIYNTKGFVTIDGGTISGNSAVVGGAIYVSQGVLTVNGGTISGNSVTTDGGAIALDTSTANITGGTISSNSATRYGGAVWLSGDGAELLLANATISGNTAIGGGALFCQTKASITMESGVLEQNTAGKNGGAGAYISTNTSFTMNGGTIQDNQSPANGGGILGLRATLNLNGGNIENNTAAKDGGGVYNWAGTVNLAGTTISGNSAVNGGGIGNAVSGTETVYFPSLNITGGAVQNNTATGLGGGIYAPADTAALALSGDVNVTGNTVDGKKSNLYLEGDQLTMTVGALGENALISITGNPYRYISAETADVSGQFQSDSHLYSVIYKDGKLYLDANEKHLHCLCDAASEGCDHKDLTFKPWESSNTLPSEGCYYLTNDVVLTGTASISGDLTLCLNGCTVTGPEGAYILATAKDSGITVNISDCGSGKLQAKGATGSTGLNLRAGTTLNLYGGTLADGYSSTGGGAMLLNGTFNMYGGEIANAKSDVNGGAVFINTNGVFTMYGGKITGSTAADRGGALYVLGTAQIKGGEISGNNAASGGAVYVNNSALTVSGGTMANNSSATHGGAVYADNSPVTVTGGLFKGNAADEAAGTGGAIFATGESSVITMEGGEISGNTAKGAGGIITQTKASLVMKGGKIAENAAGTTGGGGVYISTNTSFTMSGGEISGNTSKGNGGGIFLFRSKATVTGGKITGNEAAKQGGGLNIRGGEATFENVTFSGNSAETDGGAISMILFSATAKDGTAVIVPAVVTLGKGTVLTGNTAKSTGGAVYVNGEGSALTIQGGQITKNKAKHGGGIITVTKSQLNLESGTISSNSVTANGGGVYISTNTTLKMTGGTISGNTAKNGGGIYFLKSNLKMSGGAVSGNTATADGGGMYLYLSTSNVSGGSVTGNSAKNAGGIRIAGGDHSIGSLNVSYNTAEKDGGGIMLGRQMVKENGVNVDKLPNVSIYNSSFVGNKANNGAGLLLLSKGSVTNISGCTIRDNEGGSGGGGIYISTNATLNMRDSKLLNNSARTGANLMHLQSSGNYENVEINGGTGNNAPGIMINKLAENGNGITMKNVKILNTVGSASGAIVVQGQGATLHMDGCQVSGNATEKTGGGLFTTVKALSYIKNSEFTNNSAEADAGGIMLGLNSYTLLENCTVSGNTAGGNGGGIYNRGFMEIVNITADGNTAGGNGGGIGSGKTGSTHTGNYCGMYITGGTITGNKSAKNGGGLHSATGCHYIVSDLVLTGNEAAQGSAVWASEDFMCENLTATGNKGEHAVYFAKSNFDGQSYVTGVMKLSGKLLVKDNEGGGVFLNEQQALTIAGNGLADGSELLVTLSDGVLTQRVRGVYHYEGEGLTWTLTPGDRSVTEPMAFENAPETPVEDPTGEPTEAPTQPGGERTGNGGLIAGIIGIVAVVIAAAVAVIVLVNKKKKSANK